jgi:hypothetical protein
MKLLLIAAAVAAAPAPVAQDTPDLAWLSGRWLTESEGQWTEEAWTAPRGGVMLGTGLSGEGAGAKSFEFMRIARDAEGALTFWGAPEGRPPVPFRWESGGARHAVFVNPGHDYPQRIVYKSNGRELFATISLTDGSNAQRWRYRRIK